MAKLLKSSYYKDYTECSAGLSKLKLEIDLEWDGFNQSEIAGCIDELMENLVRVKLKAGSKHGHPQKLVEAEHAKESDGRRTAEEKGTLEPTVSKESTPIPVEETPKEVITAAHILKAAKDFINAVPTGTSERKVTVKTMLKNDFGVGKLKDLPEPKYADFVGALKDARKD